MSSSPTPGSRPGSSLEAVRPVTARTWQALNAAESPKRMSVYTNDLYGQGAPSATGRPLSPQYKPASARPATPRSAERLQHQLVGSPNRLQVPDRAASPSRLQMSTANVPPAAPKPAPQPLEQPGDSLEGLMERAARALAEDAAQQTQQAATPAEPVGRAQEPTTTPLDRPGTAPASPSRLAGPRSAAVSLAALQLMPRSGVAGALASRDSPRAAAQLFQNFAGSSPAGGSAATPRRTPLGAESGNKAAATATLKEGQQQRPSTPSFQPVPANRPATALANFTIKSGTHDADTAPAAARVPAHGSSPLSLKNPYPLPPSTAPAKAAMREVTEVHKDGLSSFGIISGAFVAGRGKDKPGTAVGDEEEGASALGVQAMLQADMLAAADVATKAGLRQFLLAPGPTDKPLQCKIYRTKSGFMKSHAQYVMVLEEGDRFLLAGRKRKGGAHGTEYAISVDQNDLSHKGSNFVGKLRSNFIGTEFVCYDDAAKPRAGSSTNARCELVAVTYQTNVLGTKGPRKMTVLIPKLDPVAGRPLKLHSSGERDGMLARYKQYDLKDTVVLRNKPPKWNDTLGAYCLNFSGRVTQASVKNFQLVSVDNMERVILQFGKVGADAFTMDYAYPMTAMQAFAICLSSFDSKLACE